jgi:hypothetical protein
LSWSYTRHELGFVELKTRPLTQVKGGFLILFFCDN